MEFTAEEWPVGILADPLDDDELVGIDVDDGIAGDLCREIDGAKRHKGIG